MKQSAIQYLTKKVLMVSPNKTVHVETILGWLKESEKIEEEKSEEYALFAIMSDRDRLNILSFIDYRKLV